MDKYTRSIAIIVVIVFSIAGFVILKAITHYIVTLPKDEVVYLDTRHMQELDDKNLDWGSVELINAYLCKQTNKKDTAALWADAFVYVSHSGVNLKPDTVVILDTSLMKKLPKNIDSFTLDSTDTIKKSIPRCRIIIPSNMPERLKKYKYKYAELTYAED